jgi:translation initiation factor IF-1
VRAAFPGGVAVSKEDLVEIQGTVVLIHGGDFVVRTEHGQDLNAKLSGRMRRFRVRVVLGDRVTVGVSPYDPSRGLITFRAS